jgi:hypothetical protein
MISYQIIDFNKITGSILVMFKYNEEILATYNVDLPFTDDGLFISGDELNNYLKNMYPQHIIDRREKLDAGIPNTADIESLVIPLPLPDHLNVESAPADQQPLTTGTMTV